MANCMVFYETILKVKFIILGFFANKNKGKLYSVEGVIYAAKRYQK